MDSSNQNATQDTTQVQPTNDSPVQTEPDQTSKASPSLNDPSMPVDPSSLPVNEKQSSPEPDFAGSAPEPLNPTSVSPAQEEPLSSAPTAAIPEPTVTEQSDQTPSSSQAETVLQAGQTPLPGQAPAEQTTTPADKPVSPVVDSSQFEVPQGAARGQSSSQSGPKDPFAPYDNSQKPNE